MIAIPVVVSPAAPGFQGERDVLNGPVRDALNALVETYACTVEFVETSSSSELFIGLVGGEVPRVPDGFDTAICLVRDLIGAPPTEWRNTAAGFSTRPGAYVREYTTVTGGARSSDLSEFATVAVDVLSLIIVRHARAKSLGGRQGIPENPGAALELAITLQRIGDVAQAADDASAAKSAYDEALGILRALLPQGDDKVRLEIDFLEYLQDELEAVERPKQSRGPLEITADQGPSGRETVGAGARMSAQTPKHRTNRALWPRFTKPSQSLIDSSEPSSRTDDGQFVPVWYGTNRQPKGNTTAGFHNGRHGTELHLGKCVVHVPESHQFGSTGTSRFWSLPTGQTGPDGRLTLREITPAESASTFSEDLKRAIGEDPSGNRALVYLHGYNTSFKDAAIRAAQIAADLNQPGVTAFFSWPSHAKPLRYPGDAQRAEASEKFFIEFLQVLVDQAKITRIDLLIHSMGNQMFARAVQRILLDATTKNIRFGVIILAAPDIDTELFKQIAPSYCAAAQKATMYVSKKDLALQVSKYAQGSRAGYGKPVTIAAGIDTVEVSKIDFSLLGHTYYAEAAPMLYDMRQLIEGNHEPRTRQRLIVKQTKSGETYWGFRRGVSGY